MFAGMVRSENPLTSFNCFRHTLNTGDNHCCGLFTYQMLQIFRKEPFFYGHDNHDQLVKIAKVYC